ncbi:ester cyclase [Microbispora sp. RL4-1S]|uniref:Ester cyclase n=1 Tax=Microbispora oryzae TaxID=2806554 RepID=A0A940WTI8_9ACTN|nr:ester cyclase [Microbispora oryzae]MBP2706749.1 ester cyclase [Microbispora oryzae]
MPDILHRISIDAPPQRVHDLIAGTDGIARWWTGRPLTGEHTAGSSFGVYFGDAEQPAAVMQVVTDTPDHVVWRVTDGPGTWIGTRITFALRAGGHGGTTLLFTHAGWQQAGEFMSGCSTNWGAYLTSLKNGAETGAFGAYPAGEISRWDANPSAPTEEEDLPLSGNVEIITRFEHAFRAADQATIDELCDPGLVDHNPAPGHEPTLAGFKQKVAGFKAIFPDIKEDLQDIVAGGDTVATRWVVTGSQQQEFMGIPAAGQTIRVEGMNFYRLKDGRVTDIWTQFDGAAMMRQLGAGPA